MSLSSDEWLSREEAAKYLDVSKSTLDVWACKKLHGLRYIKIGKRSRYKKEDLDNFIKKRLENF